MHAYLLDAVRTPFGRHRGGLAGIRTDDVAVLPDVPFPTAATLYHTQVGGRMINPAFDAEWTVSLGFSSGGHI